MRPRPSQPPAERSIADTVEIGLTGVLVITVIAALLQICGIHFFFH